MPETEICTYCKEPMLPHEPASAVGGLHYECGVRIGVGSVAHQIGTCSCQVPGASDGDPPGLSRRNGARAAAALMTRRRTPPLALEGWTVYDNTTSDYPGRFVVRRWFVDRGGRFDDVIPTIVTTVLDEARAAIPPGRERLERHPSDDAVILEVWL